MIFDISLLVHFLKFCQEYPKYKLFPIKKAYILIKDINVIINIISIYLITKKQYFNYAYDKLTQDLYLEP